jgi:hypothetical protein
MEDSDKLLLLALQRVGCSFPENVRSMQDVLKANALATMCASFLWVFDLPCEEDASSSSPVPMTTLPEENPVVNLVRVTTHIATRFTALANSHDGGFGEHEFSFRDFLAPDEEKARAACLFMLQALWDQKGVPGRDIQCENTGEDVTDVPHAIKNNITRRIFEFVTANEKQLRETRRIKGENKTVEIAIASASASLKRAYALVDTVLYKDAVHGDAIAKQTFKHLVEIHGNFQNLADQAEKTWRGDLEYELVTARLEKAKSDVSKTRDRVEVLARLLKEAETEIAGLEPGKQ